jgi:hypothetical protein
MPIKQNQLDPNINLGGGDSTGDLLDTLIRDENDTLSTIIPNQIIDDFGDEEKGTKVNTLQSVSALRLSASNLTGTYERVREANIVLSSASGAVIASLQQVAPKNTVVASNAFKIQGDVTNMFAASKNVLIAKKMTSDGITILKFLLNTEGVPAVLAVNGAPSYNSGLDETTLTLSNPETLDLDMDVSSGNYNSTLRFIPFDYQIEAKTLAASAYEEAAITDIQTLPDVRIPGENFFKALTGLTGSAIHIAANQSKNGQYAVVRVFERKTPIDMVNHLYHWFYSVDRGASWTKFSTTKPASSVSNTYLTPNDEDNYIYTNDTNIFVANNGKMVSTYWRTAYTSSSQGTWAVYSDLSAGTPVLSDIADQGSGVGSVFDELGENGWSHVAGDEVDGSYIAILIKRQNAGAVFARIYTNGGATYSATVASSPAHSAPSIAAWHVSGSGSSHRTHVVVRNGSGNIDYRYIDEGVNTWSSALSIQAQDCLIMGSSLLNNRFVLFYKDVTNSKLRFATLTSAFGGSPSAVTLGDLESNMAVPNQLADNYYGHPTESGNNAIKMGMKTIIQNNLDEKHCFFIHDVCAVGNGTPNGLNTMRRPVLWEVQDVTNYKGVQISQLTTGNATRLKELTSNQKIGQTFTAVAGQRLRAIGMQWQRNTTAPVSGTITCELYATSAGLPTTLLATSLNTMDASRIATSAAPAHWSYFKFNNYDLVNGTVYAFVFSTTAAINATDYIMIANAGSNAYAGGAPVTYNGSAWSLEASTFDLKFEIIGEYVTDFGLENPFISSYHGSNELGTIRETQQSQIQLIDSSSTNIVMTTRSLIQLDAKRPFAGHPYRSVGTIGTPATGPSTFTTTKIAGYAESNFDKHLVFCTALGTDECAQLGVASTPGVIDTAKKGEDRSGIYVINSTYANVIAGDYAADASFQSGFAQSFNGSNREVTYANDDVHNLQSTRPFAIEMEIKPTSVSVNSKFLAKYNSGAGYGWLCNIADISSGDINISILNSSGTVIGRARSVGGTVAINTYYVVRYTYDGTGSAPKIFLSTTGPTGVFTEVAYAAQLAFSGNTTSSASLAVGSLGGAEFFNGKIGYVKFAKMQAGTTSPAFNYTGYKSQPPLTITQIGTRIAAKQRIGKNNTTIGVGSESFASPGIIDGQYANQAAMVDSNDLVLYYGKDLENTTGSTMHLKASLNRVSTRDASALQGLNFRYSK